MQFFDNFNSIYASINFFSHPMQSDSDNTALIKACRRGDIKRVRELLDKGTHVDYTDKVPVPWEGTVLILYNSHADVHIHDKVNDITAL